jgi:diguanylate cyclase (GGDEF)-like protein
LILENKEMPEPRKFTEDDQIAKKYILEVSPDISKGFATKKYKEINILLKANMISNLNMDFKVSLHVLCDLISEMIQYDKALLYLWDNDSEIMAPYIVRGFPAKLPEQLQQGNLFAEWCMRFGKTFLVPFSSHAEVTRGLQDASTKSMISVPIYESNNVIGTLQLFNDEPNFFSEEDAKLLWLLMIQSEVLFRNYEDIETADSLSLLSRSAAQSNLSQFYDQLEREIGRADRRKTPISLLLIEIDHLNDYTHKFGHLKGEQTLNETGSLLMNQVRQIDTFCRYGENRFALILTETDRKGSLIFAERLRDSISRHLYQDENGDRNAQITISAGLATFPFDAKDKITLIHAVEQALHRAKDMGGNRVNLFPSVDGAAVEDKEQLHQVDLNRVTQTIHSIFSLDRLLELVVQMSMEALHAEKSSLLLLDRRSGHYIIKVACGFGKYAELIKNTRVPVENTITGWIAGMKKPFVSDNIEEIGEIPKSLYKDYRNNSFLSIPLVMDGETIGIIHLSNKAADGEIFTNEDLEQILPLSEHLTHFLCEGIRFEETQRLFSKTALSSLVVMLEAKDPYNRGHSERVAHYVEALARRMNMNQNEIEQLILSARLHDIGKIAISEKLLHKPEKLNEAEVAVVRRHPFFSWKILDAISAEDEEVKNTILQHHEKLNGSGYPYGLVGDQIPLLSRILCIADTYDSMVSKRSYRPPLSKEEALKNMQSFSKILFDPDVLKEFTEIVQ